MSDETPGLRSGDYAGPRCCPWCRGYAQGVADTRTLAVHMAAETHLGEGIVDRLADLTPERVAAAKSGAHASDCTCDECEADDA